MPALIGEEGVVFCGSEPFPGGRFDALHHFLKIARSDGFDLAAFSRFFDLPFDGLINQSFEIGTGIAVGLFCERFIIEIAGRFVAQHDVENGGTSRFVGGWDEKNPVEPAGSPEGRVEMPRGIGGSQNEDPIIGRSHSIEFVEELIDQLATGILPHVRTAGGQGIDLVEKKHARLAVAGLLEQGVQIAFALADPHFEHFMNADGHES